jgi:hypothetical protein
MEKVKHPDLHFDVALWGVKPFILVFYIRRPDTRELAMPATVNSWI